MPALFERQEGFQLLDEPAEVHQPGLRVPMDAVGQVGDQILEVSGDAADGGVARRQFLAQLVHPLGKAGGDGLNRFLLGLLPQPLVLQEHVVDGIQQGMFLMS